MIDVLLDADFPPKGSHVLSRSETRCVALTIHYRPGVSVQPERIEISVWLRSDVDGLRDWYCSPDIGIAMSAVTARELARILAEELRA